MRTAPVLLIFLNLSAFTLAPACGSSTHRNCFPFSLFFLYLVFSKLNAAMDNSWFYLKCGPHPPYCVLCALVCLLVSSPFHTYLTHLFHHHHLITNNKMVYSECTRTPYLPYLVSSLRGFSLNLIA